ncbi:hypothetical protein ACQ4PT_029664 [Festuca glaucescens]
MATAAATTSTAAAAMASFSGSAGSAMASGAPRVGFIAKTRWAFGRNAVGARWESGGRGAKIDKYILPLPTNAVIVDMQSDDEVPEPKEAMRVKRRSYDYLKQFRSRSSDDVVPAGVLFTAHELGKKPTCGHRVRAKKLARRISSSGYHLGVKKLGKKSRISSSHDVRLEKAAKPVIVCRAKYSNSFLNQHLSNGFLDLRVLCPAYDGVVHVRLIHSYKHVDQMTSHWIEVLEKARIKVGDLRIFTFMNDVLHGLMVHVSCLI